MGCRTSKHELILEHEKSDLEAKEEELGQSVEVVRNEHGEVALLAKLTHFTEQEVYELRDIYDAISSSQVKDGLIDREEFAASLGISHNQMLARALFNSFDIGRINNLNFREFVMSLSTLSTRATPAEKTRYLFSLYDVDKDGKITAGELQSLLESATHDLDLPPEAIKSICEETIKKFDIDKNGAIEFNEFEKIISGSKLLQSLTIDVHKHLAEKRKVKIMDPVNASSRKLAPKVKPEQTETEAEAGGSKGGDGGGRRRTALSMDEQQVRVINQEEEIDAWFDEPVPAKPAAAPEKPSSKRGKKS